MKRWIWVLVMLGLLSVLVAACGASGNTNGNTGSSPSSGTNEVHTQGVNFVQSSITLAKGSTLTLIDDDSTLHIIANGSWVGGAAKAAQESGAPTVNNVQLNGNSSLHIGPFTTAGTYHLYCPIHVHMNLTVTVH